MDYIFKLNHYAFLQTNLMIIVQLIVNRLLYYKINIKKTIIQIINITFFNKLNRIQTK